MGVIIGPGYYLPPTNHRLEEGAIDVESWVVRSMKDTADEDPERILKLIEAKAHRHRPRPDYRPFKTTPTHLLEP